MAGDFGTYDLSQAKLIINTKALEGCGANVQIYEFKNGEKIFYRQTQCKSEDHNLTYIKYTNDRIVSIYEKKKEQRGTYVLASETLVDVFWKSFKDKKGSFGIKDDVEWDVCKPGGMQSCEDKINKYVKIAEEFINKYDKGLLTRGQTLKVDEALWSKNHEFYARMELGGDVCVYARDNSKKWCLGTKFNNNRAESNTFNFQEDGDIVIKIYRGSALWSASNNLKLNAKDIFNIELTNDGVLQFKGIWGNVLWKSK